MTDVHSFQVGPLVLLSVSSDLRAGCVQPPGRRKPVNSFVNRDRCRTFSATPPFRLLVPSPKPSQTPSVNRRQRPQIHTLSHASETLESKLSRQKVAARASEIKSFRDHDGPAVMPDTPETGGKAELGVSFWDRQMFLPDGDRGLVTRRLTLREPPLCHRRVLFWSLTILYRLHP
ncbi:MAG: hypothetical protein JWM54_863 [Acidobacteriaceae bacterium]|nr:hypothetical protein [Acidobacteriaceae bacterium]